MLDYDISSCTLFSNISKDDQEAFLTRLVSNKKIVEKNHKKYLTTHQQTSGKFYNIKTPKIKMQNLNNDFNLPELNDIYLKKNL